ncbi:glycosyltransferase [Parasulfitobacter algicola]|uniref:Glycosyltransferase n=1 Tax=Parasulfitobacter algicola TaxID=2614809 RepID=A0ABX2IKG2_9RHOB|nr:glycosyltransferase [Sulfitobacter algicola]NSX53359.1 glycosyltransferase [Sulfitobacter algicola]
MPGAGTKTATTTNNPVARCLDLTRLLSRTGKTLTGVDRVELAYLRYFLADPVPMFGFAKTAFGYVLLDQEGAQDFERRLVQNDWLKVDFLSYVARKLNPDRKKAETTLRKTAILRGRHAGQIFQQAMPKGTEYWNVGHSNLDISVFNAVKTVTGATINVLIHDVIPLDHPEFQRQGTVEAFEKKMRNVSAMADFVVYNSYDSQKRTEYYFAKWGRVPDSIVAHLGIDLVPPDPVGLPDALNLDYPFFMVLGTIEPRKNHAFLLDLWADFGAKANLIIIGTRGWRNEDVFERLDNHPPGVTELSGLSDAAVSYLLTKTNGLLFPTIAEGYGFPPAEAALAGAPVLCNDLPIFREFLGDYPIYVTVSDAYGWKMKINELVGGKKHCKSIMLPTWAHHFETVLRIT